MFITLQNVDELIYRWFNQFQRSLLITRIFRCISRSGDGYLYIMLGIFAMLLDNPHSKLFVATSLLAYFIEIPSFIGLKLLFKRSRPYVNIKGSYYSIEAADKFSLPSGHTAAAAVMMTMTACYYPDFFIVALLWTVLIGLSRVILGVHYLSDIFAGALLGISAALLAKLLIAEKLIYIL
ncbi:MAG: phosphatase PAP2 family protein [Pseudomonadales bacterium]|nr:phosphatase PAP2 family protein [Pseudomonadales bacterium]